MGAGTTVTVSGAALQKLGCNRGDLALYYKEFVSQNGNPGLQPTSNNRSRGDQSKWDVTPV
jgi:hypothetical protein